MTDKDFIKSLVEEKLKESDSFLVEISVDPDNRIVVEIDNDSGVSIDECVVMSRYIEECLDREKEDFELEVGSSGLTSPFKTVRQYVKNLGKEVEMLLKNGTKLTGILKAADGQCATITVGKKVKADGSKRKTTVREDQAYSYDEIKYTKYLIGF
ncbi:MAG: ribosome assembly cofactor RimP [Tannerella sp.]|jgi:ribosome maturation factor RimP|nr:ribosome assembly cofactor RimP [Tannerella sp.]